MKKRFVFVTLLIAMIVLTALPVSLVCATDIRLSPVSGSDCDPRTFEYNGHTIAEGFAVSISADLPFDRETQIKFGCAVAGLGAPWDERGPGYFHEYNPYVKEMWVKVEGDYYYSAWEDSIIDNTGTGGSSSSFFEAVLNGIGFVFLVYDIYNWLAEVYQTPPVAEWQEGAHWSKAISRQGHWTNLPPTFVPYLATDDPHLQTACANVLAYFTEGSSYILTITAGAEIYVQWHDIINGGVVQTYIGTHSVSFEVSLTRTLSISASSGGTTNPVPGTHVYSYGSSVTVTASAYSGYTFNYWLLDGATVYNNSITVTMYSDHTLSAYFVKLANLVVKVPQAPPEGVKVWVDNTTYKAYASSPVSVTVKAGQHTIEAERSFLKEGWTPGTYFFYFFECWSDGSKDNPRTMPITSDTTLTAYYIRSKYGWNSEQPEQPE